MIRRLSIALVVVALGLALLDYLFYGRRVPSTQTIKHIESQIVMPEGAHPLTDYLRFYAYGWKGWRPVVVGSYQFVPDGVSVFFKTQVADAAVPGVPGAYALQGPPKFYAGDSGVRCQFVFIYYDESTRQLLSIEENGEPNLAWCNP
jgi:hypothetical protein